MPATHVVVVPHTHWDREWYRTRESFRVRWVRLVDGLLDLLEGDPGFRHFTLDGQTIALRDYLEIRPGARGRIERLVRAGRLSVGPWTVLPDEWLVSGEALIRNLRLGLAEAESLGAALEVGYVPDQFGHVGQLPQLFAGMGFEAAVLWRGVGADVDDTLFRWRAPDGSELLTAYLARGYGNGAHLPSDPGELAERLRAELRALPGRSRSSALLMNGSDHLPPRPDLPAALASAAALLPEVRLEIGSLSDYLARVRDVDRDELPLHAGELRSGLRAPLLAGCASARIAQKRADQHNDRLLTRQLEPLSAWLGQLGGRADPELLESIWRIALENHPHDSICGCSIDAVHEEVDVRFRRVADLAGGRLGEVTRELAARVEAPAGPGWPVVVWNPHPAGPCVAEGEVELPLACDAGAAPALRARNAGGETLPLDVAVADAGCVYAAYRLPARVVAGLLRGFPPEFFGDPVCALTRRREAGLDWIEPWLGAQPPPELDWEARRTALADELEAEGDAVLGFRPRRMPRLRVGLADALPGVGLRSYRLVPAPSETGPAARVRRVDGGFALANATWTLHVSEAGRVRARHGPTGLELDDLLQWVDEGDRGDTYTFDPVPDSPPVSGLERVRVSPLPQGASAGVEIRGAMRVPLALDASRRRRSARCVGLPVRLRLRLWDAVDRIDVDVEVDNRARDHRLRLHVAAPFAPRGCQVESAFELAPRPLGPLPPGGEGGRPAELPSAAGPQRRFASLIGADVVLSVANRGLPEVAALRCAGGGGALALTLVRAVGWLSRDDLARRPGHAGPPIETPGAQAPGPTSAQLAIFAHPLDDPTRVAAACRFAEPPLLFAGGSPPGAPLRDGSRLLELDDPEIAVSAIEPDPRGGCRVRLVNLSARPRRASLRWRGAGPGLVAVDLRDRPRSPEAAPRRELDLAFRPGEIVALAAVPPAGGPKS